MPLYDFRCTLCGETSDVQVKMADRFERTDCPSCGETACCEQVVGASPPNFGTERKRGDSRIITDERQVAQELGANWRDAGTTGKEGGAGKKVYGHG